MADSEDRWAFEVMQPRRWTEDGVRGKMHLDDRLGSNGIDHVANFLVMKHEIDKLRDLDVIDGDRGLVLTCDDQVLLLGPLQF